MDPQDTSTQDVPPEPPEIEIPLISRDKWYGMPPQLAYIEPMTEPHTKVCFVPTESTPCDCPEECIVAVEEIQKRNMVFRNWPDTPFNFLIGGDGYVYEGRGWQKRYKDFGNPAMWDTLQIAYIGYFKDKDPPKKMVDLGTLLIEYGKQHKYIAEDYNYMECPLSEYYQYPRSLEAYYKSKDYQDFLKTIPPPLPKKPET